MRFGRDQRVLDRETVKGMNGHWRLDCTHWAPPSWFQHSQVRHMMLVFCHKCGDVRRVAARGPWPA